MLKVENLRVAYGHIEVLKGISFSVEMGEIVALIGGNGAGKTTTLSTISGLVRPSSGTISWKGEKIQNAAVESIVGSGLAHCPEGRRIFPGLTVLENLITGTASLAATGNVSLANLTTTTLGTNSAGGSFTAVSGRPTTTVTALP